MADTMSIDNKPNPPPPDNHHDDSDESLESSPVGDLDLGASAPAAGSNGNAANNSTGQDGQQPKRKGGRKPIYATSEERKQRNRQAQAAFRERRTEYIKQLEETIRVHESNLHNLQTAHRTAADECLMLRYKNSLLERILLEKGIDVQAELRAKTGSPNLGPTHMPQNLVQPPPIQRALINRHHQSRRSNSSIAPKSEPASALPPPHGNNASPKNRPTPPSHSNSPTATASAFSPAPSDNMSMRGSVAGMPRQQMHQMQQGGQQPRPQQQPTPQQQPQHGRQQQQQQPSQGASYYPTPAFQNHIEQLEQEYDAQADMVDDSELDTPSGPGPYPTFANDGTQMLSPSSNGPPQHMSQPDQQQHHGQTTGQPYPSMTSLLDQNLDWDPFGLSASMAFPPQPYQLDQTNMR